ncbi:MAG: DUF4190 domain-containing protein [Phycisphaerales bacterium JB038]
MTQYHAPMDAEQQYGKPVRTSGIAIASLVCSLIFFCPITTIIGPILGLVGLLTISEAKGTKGKGLAAAGLVLGVLFTVGWGIGGYYAGQYSIRMYALIQDGPRTALTAGFADDYQGFQDAFHGPGANNPAGAEAFVTQLRSRYGEFVDSALPPTAQPRQRSQSDPTMVATYLLTFENKELSADVELVMADPNAGAGQPVFVYKLGYTDVLDPELGDLKYPPPTGPQDPSADEPGDEG